MGTHTHRHTHTHIHTLEEKLPVAMSIILFSYLCFGFAHHGLGFSRCLFFFSSSPFLSSFSCYDNPVRKALDYQAG